VDLVRREAPWGQPDDQRADDALSLVYDWEPLAAELDVMDTHACS